MNDTTEENSQETQNWHLEYILELECKRIKQQRINEIINNHKFVTTEDNI